ncbi:5-pentadecatrienyl resorcinol O-methyltransferase-like [Phragmites australis]|uniref:5-pentadecatrienyl resorcinol O-methyltransferase-like n=1 Tax=Phragmites australis TaxID=29695 RepID=UPI002D76B8B9|nr:5-pentadecatrienyl resorcinol O-methyltransferase-like [Phragmites australis]
MKATRRGPSGFCEARPGTHHSHFSISDSLCDYLRRFMCRAVNEAEELVATHVWHDLCLPNKLRHVVASVLPGERGRVEFVAGDMFEHVPKSDAVLLKWILHGWDDEKRVRILRRCREAIPVKEAGGRVIVMDLVVGSSPADEKATETQLLLDVMMMRVVGSPERDEREWRKVFEEAGFSGYKIVAVLGIRSVIEVYFVVGRASTVFFHHHKEYDFSCDEQIEHPHAMHQNRGPQATWHKT